MAATPPTERGSALARVGLRMSDWFERWFPDAFVLALAAVAIVYVAAILFGDITPFETAQHFGAGFWDLVTFTMQMSLIVVTGYAVASSPPIYKVISKLASVPSTGRGAAAYVGLFSMLSSLISWSFSLIFSALLVREVARRVKGSDYRALGAAAYLGVGSVWALGLSSSAALLMASPDSLPDSIEAISGVIPLSQTLGLWQSLLTAGVLIAVSMAIAFYSAPPDSQARSMKAMGIDDSPIVRDTAKAEKPGEWLEHSPLLTVIICALGFAYLGAAVVDGGPSVLLQLNHYVFLFLILGMLLHWRPRSFARAILAAIAPVAGVIIQYPMYAGIVRMLTESGLATRISDFFVSISTEHTFPFMVGIYSAALGIFIPSAGGKWLIEAPYLLEAGKELNVHLGWVVQTYNATEALANLIHPFWMLPLVGILALKPRDIVGYSMLQFIVHVPLVLFLVWILNYTLSAIG
jgi:short-chain fatty acids transporter